MESRCYWLSWALLWWGIVSPPLVCKSVPTWIQHCSAQGPEHRFQAWLPKILLRGGDWDKYGRRRNTAAEMLWHFDKSYARRFQKLALWFKKKKKKASPISISLLFPANYSVLFPVWSMKHHGRFISCPPGMCCWLCRLSGVRCRRKGEKEWWNLLLILEGDIKSKH